MVRTASAAGHSRRRRRADAPSRTATTVRRRATGSSLHVQGKNRATAKNRGAHASGIRRTKRGVDPSGSTRRTSSRRGGVPLGPRDAFRGNFRRSPAPRGAHRIPRSRGFAGAGPRLEADARVRPVGLLRPRSGWRYADRHSGAGRPADSRPPVRRMARARSKCKPFLVPDSPAQDAVQHPAEHHAPRKW